jgi:hypothetical protein
MSRIAGIVMPFACYFAIDKGDYMSPYYIFLVIAIISIIATVNLPFDTTGKALDAEEDETIVDPYANNELGKVDDIQSVESDNALGATISSKKS